MVILKWVMDVVCFGNYYEFKVVFNFVQIKFVIGLVVGLFYLYVVFDVILVVWCVFILLFFVVVVFYYVGIY